MNGPPPFRVAFVTGMSNPDSWNLSPLQHRFIKSFAFPDTCIYPLNFPYTACAHPYRPTPILRASARNAWMFFFSMQRRFREKYHSSVSNFLSESRHTILLAGSSGLELLNNLRLPAEILQRISVFAYGPVSRRLPLCRRVLVQGTRDWYSRLFHSEVDYRVSCGHMNYLENDEVKTLCARFIQDTLTRLNSSAAQ